MGTNMSVIPGLGPGMISHGAALAELGAVFLVVVAGLVTAVGIVRGRRPMAAVAAGAGGFVVAAYLGVLLVLSLASHERTLARGEEKYFCDLDCHLAYAVVGVRDVPGAPAGGRRAEVTLRIRFDATTTAPWRPREATLAPEPREFLLVDGSGRRYAPVQIDGGPVAAGEVALLAPLKPGDAHEVRLAYDVPQAARDLRLLVRDAAWDYAFTIAHENSLLHRKTWLGL